MSRVGAVLVRRNIAAIASRASLSIPTDVFSPAHAFFVKVERRSLWFFDEAGWVEIPPAKILRTPSPQFVSHVALGDEMPVQAVVNGRDQKLTISHRGWTALFAVVLIWLTAALSANINRPWITALDFNGAVWSQSAHNILRGGFARTLGASSGFYFGPLPIPVSGYYLHHPPLLHLAITIMFAVFGEHEWVARLLPIGCSLASVVLLWLLVRSCAGSRTATLSAGVFASLPMELRYGQMVNFEPCVLMLILGALLCLRYWNLSADRRWKHFALGLIFVGLWVDWAMHIFFVSLCLCWFGQSREGRRFARTLLILALVSAMLYLIRIRLLRPDAWENLSHTFVVRLGSRGPTASVNFSGYPGYSILCLPYFFVLNWVLAAAGAAIVLRDRFRDEGLLWALHASVRVIVMDAIFEESSKMIPTSINTFRSTLSRRWQFWRESPSIVSLTFLQGVLFRNDLAFAGEVSACLLLLLIGIHGVTQTKSFSNNFAY